MARIGLCVKSNKLYSVPGVIESNKPYVLKETCLGNFTGAENR